MFVRVKKAGPYEYLQIVENRWEKGGSKQRVIATVGRLDQLQESGQLDGLLQSAIFWGLLICPTLGCPTFLLGSSANPPI